MPLDRHQAQRRAEDILAFRRELARLDAEAAPGPDAAQRAALARHHDALLADYRARFDIDCDARSRGLSLGMRIASLLGALAMAASVLFLFHQFWGLFGEAAQVAILAGASLASLLATFAIRRRDGAGYFSKLAAMVAFACLVLDTVMLGQIFNLTPTDNALLAWAAYALLLAYACDARLLLVCGLLCVLGFVAARVGTWSGVYWLSAGERPEHFFPAALAIFALPWAVPHRRFADFAPAYRVIGLLAALIPVLVLAHWGDGSYLPWPRETVEGAYQVLGFLLAALVIALGIRQRWGDTVNTGVTFFVLFLYTKLFDWWWEVMPKYLFFLVLSLVAVLVLLVLRRARRFARPEAPA